MKQLKKIKLLPLTDFDDLKLNVAKKQEVDLSALPPEKVKELLQKIYALASKTPGVIVATKVGDKRFVNTQIKGSKDKNKIFTFPEPNPVCIYYQSANEHLQKSYSQKNKFFSDEAHYDYVHHYEEFAEYFKETSEGITQLCATIEGFINQLLPDSLQLQVGGSMKNKDEVEWLDLNTKIREVLPHLSGIDFQQTNPKDYENISLVVAIRNDLIHLKKSSQRNITHYQALFKRLLDFNHIACSDGVFTFLNTIQPNYLIEIK